MVVHIRQSMRAHAHVSEQMPSKSILVLNMSLRSEWLEGRKIVNRWVCIGVRRGVLIKAIRGKERRASNLKRRS
jgi:hypothetical protein